MDLRFSCSVLLLLQSRMPLLDFHYAARMALLFVNAANLWHSLLSNAKLLSIYLARLADQ